MMMEIKMLLQKQSNFKAIDVYSKMGLPGGGDTVGTLKKCTS